MLFRVDEEIFDLFPGLHLPVAVARGGIIGGREKR